LNEPLISIIIPTYNRVNFIGETLDSVLAQTYENWECYVIDDGSNDNTRELIEFYVHKDSRFKYYHRPSSSTKGANVCRNIGLKLSKGALIQFLDSDDLISSTKIEEQVGLISGSENALATTKWGVFENADRNLYEDLEVYKNFNNSLSFLKAMYRSIGYFPPHAYLIHRSLIEKAGGWNEYLKVNQDGEFMTRVICNSKSFFFAPNSYVFYRASRQDSTSVLNEDNIFDHYHCMKLIESHLMIRFKSKITEFQNIKRKAFLRIPDDLSKIYKDDFSFFSKQIKEKKKKRKPVKEFKKRIKLLIRNLLCFLYIF
jgi:glycosyltransferase involved in cell wall biosynthesis